MIRIDDVGVVYSVFFVAFFFLSFYVLLSPPITLRHVYRSTFMLLANAFAIMIDHASVH